LHTATLLSSGKVLVAGGITNGAYSTASAELYDLATTNAALPLSNWTLLSGVTEVAPGQFQFTDLQATNTPRRCYRLRAP